MQTKTLYKKDIYNGSLILVNHDYPIHQDYCSSMINVYENVSYQVEQKVYKLFWQCMNHLQIKDEIVITSAYRSAQDQEKLYNYSLKENGKDYTQKHVALSHHSEYETGLAIDLALCTNHIDIKCPNFPYTGICQKFRELCYDYGFVERYGEFKQSITHMSQEPWHFRYVGFPHSLIMKDKNLCLEEYHDFLKQYSPYHPYTYVVNHRVFDIYYVPVKQSTTIALRSDVVYQISGNNMDGVIVTVWRNCL